MLKRRGIGFILLCISLVFLLVMYTVTHALDNELCVYSQRVDLNTSVVLNPWSLKVINTTYVTAQHTLSALFQMLVYISVWEFICCQSRHSMKGLMFGVFYCHSRFISDYDCYHIISYFWNNSLFYCGTTFLLAIGVVAFLVYVCVSKRYKNRMRDEPSHVRR